MKRLFFCLFTAIIACSLGLQGCSKDSEPNSKPDPDPGHNQNPTPTPTPATPVITITTQPEAATSVTEGSVTGSLTVAASVTENATLSYQWYSNTSNSSSGGTTVSGATSASLTIPTTLKAGAYYYFSEIRATGGAASVRSNVATVTVAEPEPEVPSTPLEVNITGTINHTTFTSGQKGTVTLNRFPATVDEWKKVQEKIGGEPHGAAALQIMASEMYRRHNASGLSCVALNSTKSCNTSTIARLKTVFAASNNRPYQMASFLKGATPDNGYNPTKPYTIEIRVAEGKGYTDSKDFQATIINLEVLTSGSSSGSVPVAVLKTLKTDEPAGENGKYFIVWECSTLFVSCKTASFANPFNGLD